MQMEIDYSNKFADLHGFHDQTSDWLVKQGQFKTLTLL